MEVLKEAREKGVRRVWMQPGSFDKEVLGFARDEFETAVGGNGECVLANGEGALRGAGREGEKL